jgi:hypothetical protein
MPQDRREEVRQEFSKRLLTGWVMTKMCGEKKDEETIR